MGFRALFNNTTGNHNTAYGAQALFSNGSNRPGSSDNTATGYRALYLNADGEKNTANGAYALSSNTEGIGNTATGYGALARNVLGNANTATGYQALFKNTDASGNTATGYQALFNNTTGAANIAYGGLALYNNTTGEANTAVGHNALSSNTTGTGNIALGDSAGQNLTTGDFNVDIGNQGVAGDSFKIRIGQQGFHAATYIAGISGVAVAGDAVVVNSSGQLGVGMPSSKRFKDEIKPMGDASEAVLALKPVTFRYKDDLDPKRVTRFGLVAEEVEKINPNLVARDAKGEVYTVRYEAVNAMLLNEFLKEHGEVEQLKATATQQANEIKELKASLKEQAAQIQKVSAELEMAKPAAKVARSDQ